LFCNKTDSTQVLKIFALIHWKKILNNKLNKWWAFDTAVDMHWGYLLPTIVITHKFKFNHLIVYTYLRYNVIALLWGYYTHYPILGLSINYLRAWKINVIKIFIISIIF